MNVVVVARYPMGRPIHIVANRTALYKWLRLKFDEIHRIVPDESRSTGIDTMTKCKSYRGFAQWLQPGEPIHIELRTGKSYTRYSIQVMKRMEYKNLVNEKV